MKELHIINVGNSLLRQFKNSEKAKKYNINQIAFNNEKVWGELLSNQEFMDDIYNFLKPNPQNVSGELKAFFKVIGRKEPNTISVCLFGTNTNSNRICSFTIEKLLREYGISSIDYKEVEGLRLNSNRKSRNHIKAEAKRLMLHLIAIIQEKQKEQYKVFVNATGGYKFYVAACMFAGLFTNATTYYMHEEANELIFFPTQKDLKIIPYTTNTHFVKN